MKTLNRNPVGILGLVSLMLISSGCLSNKLVRVSNENRDAATEKLNRAAKGREARIEIINGDTLQVKNIAVRGDSVFWYSKETRLITGTALSEIRMLSISKRNTAKGLGRGFLMGAGLGATIMGIGILNSPSEVYDCETLTIGMVIFGVPMGFFGFLGMLAGAATKTIETYDFDSRETKVK